MSGEIGVAVAAGVLRVTVERAEKRNALSRALLTELRGDGLPRGDGHPAGHRRHVGGRPSSASY
jgi:hypothetical protein